MSIKVKSAKDDRSGSRVANIVQPLTAIAGSTNSTNSTNGSSTNSSNARPAPKGGHK